MYPALGNRKALMCKGRHETNCTDPTKGISECRTSQSKCEYITQDGDLEANPQWIIRMPIKGAGVVNVEHQSVRLKT